jgi:hypothetical protein
MSGENDLLDEDYEPNKEVEQKEKFNYTKYSISYIFLMITIGALLSKIMSVYPLKPYLMFMGSIIYISFGMIISLTYEGLRFVFNKFISKKPLKEDIHPTWFRILENCFYAWCVIVLVTYFGNKVL